MTYLPNIPVPTISPKTQASKIQTNFAQYATVFAKNHTALNTFLQGDHEAITMELQTVDPVVKDDLAVLFCKNAPSNLGAQPQLFSKILQFLPNQFDSTTAPNAAVQLTYNVVNIAGPVYQSFLPGGNLLYFGMTSITKPTPFPVTVTLSPVGTKLLVAIAITNDVETGGSPRRLLVSTNITSSSTFDIYSDYTRAPATINFSWLAIASA